MLVCTDLVLFLQTNILMLEHLPQMVRESVIQKCLEYVADKFMVRGT